MQKYLLYYFQKYRKNKFETIQLNLTKFDDILKFEIVSFDLTKRNRLSAQTLTQIKENNNKCTCVNFPISMQINPMMLLRFFVFFCCNLYQHRNNKSLYTKFKVPFRLHYTALCTQSYTN